MVTLKYFLTLEVVALVCLGDDFEHLQIFFDDTKKKLSPIQNRVFNQNILSEEINKRLKIVKLIKDRNTKRNNFILCADNKVFKQDVMEKKSFKLFFDTKESYGKIIDVFEVPNFVSSKNLVILATQENYLVEIDIDKVEQHSDNTIISFLTKLKQEGKTKITKYEINYSSRKPSHTYYSFVSLEDNKNPRNIIKFDENIITLKFRPKNPILKQNNNQFYIKNQKAKQFINNNHVAISFGNNTLNIFHYESKCQVYEFVSYYGNFICLEYTPDGRLLGAGTESDQLYILDAELNTLIYTLEGHKNYITNIIFFENIADNNDEITSSASTKLSDNNNSSKASEGNLEQTVKRRRSSIRIHIQEVSLGEMRTHILKENNYSKADTLQIENIRLSRTGKSEIFDNNDENKIILTYDILTTGMDGCVAVWRIEHSYDEFMFNEKNYPDISTYNQSFNLCKTDNVLPLNLFPYDRTKISYSCFLKISNNPIIKMIYNENFFVFITKKISTGGIVHLKIYNGVTKVEEIIETTNFLTQGNLNEDTDAMITERKGSYSHVNNNSSTKVDHLIRTQSFPSSETKKHLNTNSSEKSESSKNPIPSYSDNKRIFDKDTKRNKIPMKDNNVKK